METYGVKHNCDWGDLYVVISVKRQHVASHGSGTEDTEEKKYMYNMW